MSLKKGQRELGRFNKRHSGRFDKNQRDRFLRRAIKNNINQFKGMGLVDFIINDYMGYISEYTPKTNRYVGYN